VDDRRDAAFVLGRLLETLGQNVQTTQDPTAALEMARRTTPDVVITDIAMPDMDGYELAARLRQEPALEHVAIVALSGYGQPSDLARSAEAGIDFHLVKPVSLEALKDLLRSLPVTFGGV